ncbi:MAG: ATP-binding protein [Lachnospiraceae bacterium]|nr:ATP-binding protein [Lachnospiraceae bacterium]
MREYQKRQLENRHRQEARIREVYQALPRMEQFDGEIGAVSLEQAKKLLAGEEDALHKLRFKLKELKESREALLAVGGFPPDYMEQTYTCSACRDTGYVDGKKCHCLRQAEIAVLYHQSNLGCVLEQENFDRVSYDYYDKEWIVNEKRGLSQYDYMKAVIEECHAYVEHFRERGGNLLFQGEAGTGKTFLTNCIAKALLDRSEAVVYLTASDLFQIFSDRRFDRGDPDREERYVGILGCDLLIIDDLGTELNNSLGNSDLFYCLNGRALKGLSTIISTNLPMNELRDNYSERITSRISSGYRIIPLFGEDIRIKKKITTTRGVVECGKSMS